MLTAQLYCARVCYGQQAIRGTAGVWSAERRRMYWQGVPHTDMPQISSRSRYAKWKAADISKALRENRKPTPGPANQPEEEAEVEATLASLQTEANTAPTGAAEDAGAPEEADVRDTTPRSQMHHPGSSSPRLPRLLEIRIVAQRRHPVRALPNRAGRRGTRRKPRRQPHPQ